MTSDNIIDFDMWRLRLNRMARAQASVDMAAFLADEERELSEAEELFLDQILMEGAGHERLSY